MSSWVDIPCPVCGADEREPYYQFPDDRYERVIYWHTCSKCGVVYQSPYMSKSYLEEFYKSEYRLITHGQEEPHPRDIEVQHMRASYLVEYLKKYDVKPLSFIDIGCSIGALMEAVRDEFSASVVGIEPHDAHREYAQERGLTVYEEWPEHDKFDLVGMIHLLEHFSDPVEKMQQARDMMVRGGYMLLEVPNGYSVAHAYLPHHALAWTPETIQQFLENRMVFKIVDRIQHAQPFDSPLPMSILYLLQRP